MQPTAELVKSERDPISTSGPSIFSMSPNQAISSDKSIRFSPLAVARPLTIRSWPEALNASGSRRACWMAISAMPLLSLLFLISRNSPQQLGMVSPELVPAAGVRLLRTRGAAIEDRPEEEQNNRETGPGEIAVMIVKHGEDPVRLGPRPSGR